MLALNAAPREECIAVSKCRSQQEGAEDHWITENEGGVPSAEVVGTHKAQRTQNYGQS